MGRQLLLVDGDSLPWLHLGPYKSTAGVGMELSWWRVYPACTRPYVCLPTPCKPDTVVRYYNPSPKDIEAGELEVQAYPWLHNEFEGQPGLHKIL